MEVIIDEAGAFSVEMVCASCTNTMVLVANAEVEQEKVFWCNHCGTLRIGEHTRRPLMVAVDTLDRLIKQGLSKKRTQEDK